MAPIFVTYRRTTSLRALAAAGCAVLAMTTGVATTHAAPAHTLGCGTWTKSTVASGFGMLENLGFDGRGGLLLSEQSLTGGLGALQRLGTDGSRRVLAAVDGPGGIVVNGHTVYFNTGNTTKAALTNSADGGISALDLDTGSMTTVAAGIHMPNGLAQLPDGSFITSHDMGSYTGLTQSRNGTGTSQYGAGLTSTNGLSYDSARHRLWTTSTFTPTTTISAVDIDHPGAAPASYALPGIGQLNSADDLTVGPDGAIYVALNVIGQVARIDPDTGHSCLIAEGLPFTSSVRFGSGPGWDRNSLYATSFLGTVTRITP